MKKNQKRVTISIVLATIALVMSITAATTLLVTNSELKAVKKELLLQNFKHNELTARFYNLQKCYQKQDVDCTDGKYFDNKQWKNEIDKLIKSD